ncbi:MAG: hypothetical protein H5T59_02300, partial [Anaerolineae bacterium]|nr:hypothetical protein [Anaerolineae bacterium]
FIGVCLNFFRGVRAEAGGGMFTPRIWSVLPAWDGLAGWVLLPLALGALAVINTWDMPTYLALAVLAFLLREYLRTGRVLLVPAAVFTLWVGGASLLFYWPFFAHYQAISVGLGLVHTKDALSDWLTIWGFFYFLAATWVLMALAHNRSRLALLRWARLFLRRWERLPRLTELHGLLVREARPAYVLGLYGVGLVALAWVVLIALKFHVPAALLPLLVGGALLLLGREEEAEETFTTLLLFVGLLVAAGVEVVYMKDFLGGGDHYRMNTLFKFYIQVWVLLGCGTAAALPRIWRRVAAWRSRSGRWAWQAAFILLLVGTSLFLPLGTAARVQDRFPGERPPIGTLDGMAYMTVGRYMWPDPEHPIDLKWDYLALQWLLEHVKGTPVIAEGRIDYYREGGMRVASYTGLPTFLGAHQGEQRYSWQVGERDGIAKEFFNTPDIARAQEIIRDLHVEYIYIGTLERYVYDPRGLEKFAQMEQMGLLETVYQNDQVTIYRVVER